MNCEGSMSMTPPSSDNDIFDQIESSPVLKRKKRKERPTENAQQIYDQSNSNHSILKNELFTNRQTISSNNFIKATSDDKWNKECIHQLYCRAIFQVREMEKRCELSSAPDALLENNLIYSHLKEIYKFVENQEAMKNKDLVTALFTCLFNISSESSHLLLSAKSQLLRFYKTRKHFYGENSSLHVCKNSQILKIYHLFSEIHSALLDVTTKALSQNIVLNDFKTYNGDQQFIITNINDVLVQFSSKIVNSLCELAFQRFNHEYNQAGGNSLESLLKSNPYPCSCFNELLIKCFDKFKEKQNFWTILIEMTDNIVISSRIDSNDFENIKFKNIEISLSFCWWWFQSMTLGGLTVLCHLITRLVRLSLSHSHENALSCQLSLYKSIIEIQTEPWTLSDFTSFKLIWLHLVRNLNEKYSSEKSPSGIEKFTVKEKTVPEWILECRNVKKSDFNSPLFHVILGILSLVVEDKDQWKNINENDVLLSKIEISTMKKLTESGIYRLFSVALTILLTCPAGEIKSFLVEFLNLMKYCGLSKTDYRKQKLVITGYFSLMQLCSERNIECHEIEEKLKVIFKHICRLFADKNNSQDHRNEYFKTIVFLLQNIIYYFQTTNSERLDLLPKHVVANMLKEMKEKENSVILNLIAELTICLRQKKSKNKEFLAQLEDLVMEIFIWIKRQNIYNDQTKDLICEISLITVNRLPSFSIVLKHFATAGKITQQVRIEYLTRILSINQMVSVLDNDYINNKEPELCDAVIQGWAQCNVIHDTEALNSVMRNLKIVKDLFVVPTTKFCLRNLLVAIGERYNLSKNFMERIGWASKARRWFTTKTVECAVSTLKSKTMFTSDVHVFSQFALIFEHCSQMLYTEGKPSFISYAIDGLLIDIWNETETPPNALLLTTLHHFVIGILSAGGTKSNSLKIKLKSIIELHLTRCPITQHLENKNIPHPFISFLKCEENVEYKNYFVSLLLDHANRRPTPDNLYAFVEIIHVWVDTKIPVSSFSVFHQCLPVLQQARLQFRFNNILQDKIKFLIKNIRGLT